MGADVGLWIVQSGLEPYQWSCIAVVTDDASGEARDAGGRFIGRSEQNANARLIAAAPAMLDMLRECRATFAFAADDNDTEANAFIAQIDAVLAMAEQR